MATNFLLVKAKTDQKQLAGAIAARMRQESHTVLECYGAAAVTNAIYVSAVASPDVGTSHSSPRVLLNYRDVARMSAYCAVIITQGRRRGVQPSETAVLGF